EDLLPTLTAAVAQWTVDQDSLTLEDANTEGIATALLDKLDIDPGTVEIDGDRQAPVEVRAWVRDLVAFTVRAIEEDVTINEAPESLTRIGTGRGLLNAGRAALRAGPVALLDVLEVTPQVAATLNEGEWVGTRKETRARSLGALDSLSDALDIQLVFSTPRMESLLVEDHPDWTSRHLNLTEDADTSHPSKTDTAAGEDAALAREAWDILREREWSGTGYTRILGNIPASGASRGDLAADDDVSLSEGSIYAYVDDLAAAGFVTIDDSTRPSRVVLTELGASIADYVDAKGSVQNPVQASLTQSPNRGTSECTPHHQQDPSGDSHRLGDD
ncbi:replication protein, partial [Halobacterium salinarum]|nr:replication protein [Halobacterium salinarum]